jgi:hypothetical protein
MTVLHIDSPPRQRTAGGTSGQVAWRVPMGPEMRRRK